MAKILITGIAGFIGSSLVEEIVRDANDILGIDNVNDYYDVKLKTDRLNKLGIYKTSVGIGITESSKFQNLRFINGDISDLAFVLKTFDSFNPEIVINFAAQAGVRYSIDNPGCYIQSNIVGFYNILEACRSLNIKSLIYASSSSVYGNQKTFGAFNETFETDRPISLYAATKKSNEVLAYSYSSLYGIRSIGLRFFTVYGPWGRPDMAYYKFVKSILSNDVIQVFNHGNLLRDFTFISDVTKAVKILIDKFNKLPLCDNYGILNIGNASPVTLIDFIQTIENILGKKANLANVDMQLGDVFSTHADVELLQNMLEYTPETKLYDGLSNFIDWYKWYNHIQ